MKQPKTLPIKMAAPIAGCVRRLVSWLADTFIGPNEPPPGFKIVTNGKHFRWAFPSGNMSNVNRKSYRAACKGAWDFGYTPPDENPEQWKPANASNSATGD